MFVVAVVMAKVGVQEAKRSGVLRLDEERALNRGQATAPQAPVVAAAPTGPFTSVG